MSMRTCARSGCSSPAAVILTYDRVAQTAYLYSVDDPSTRTPGDLCQRHLGRLVLPRSWHLDDRRVAEVPVPAGAAARPEKSRSAAPRPDATRRAARRKWAEAGPSLFETPASDVAASRPHAADSEPVWMPRFGPDTELDDVLDAETPLLRRAFGGS
jgi:Protein of unknown function (DUF3499)